MAAWALKPERAIYPLLILNRIKSPAGQALQVEFVVAFLGTTLARAVAAPLNQNYRQVGGPSPTWGLTHAAPLYVAGLGPAGRSGTGVEGKGGSRRRAQGRGQGLLCTWRPWCRAGAACGEPMAAAPEPPTPTAADTLLPSTPPAAHPAVPPWCRMNLSSTWRWVLPCPASLACQRNSLPVQQSHPPHRR